LSLRLEIIIFCYFKVLQNLIKVVDCKLASQHLMPT
jgi:hypothetical protein